MITNRWMVAALVLAVAGVATAAEQESRAWKQNYGIESVKRVEIELPPGTKLKLRTSASPELTIDGKVTVAFEGSPSKLKRQSILEGIEVAAEIRGNRLRIFDSREGDARSGWARRLHTDFDVMITLPEWTHVEVRQRSGEVDANGAFGNVMVGMRSGSIDLVVPRERVKELSAKTRIGEVKADYGRRTEELEGFLPGEATYENENGLTRIRLSLTTGDINVKLRE